MSEGSRECEDSADWEGFGAAEAIPASSRSRIYFTVLGDDANSGRLKRIQMFQADGKWSIMKLGRVLQLGKEVYALQANEARPLEDFVVPKGPEGVYMLMASYDFPHGEVTYGFKVQR